MDDEEENTPRALWRVQICCRAPLDGALAEELSAALEEIVAAVFLHNREADDGDDWAVTLTTRGPPDTAAILAAIDGVRAGLVAPEDLRAEELPDRDWLAHVHETFPPVRAGSFFVYGGHYTGSVPADAIPLRIDAATAFGTGEHETTQACLLLLEKLAAEGHVFENALDMGCGSGILAIAMTKLWPFIAVTAVDIDPESVAVTRRHAAMNGADSGLRAACGDGYAAPEAGAGAPYGLIAANILSGPLVAMAPDLARMLRPGGFCILSGLLTRQKEEVLDAHRALGLVPVTAQETGNWQGLLLQKPAG